MYFKVFFNIIIASLDLIEFDHDFYDRQLVDTKILKRFLVSFGFNNDGSIVLNIEEKKILIESPAYCDCLQNNIT
jgi:hypothetical protein